MIRLSIELRESTPGKVHLEIQSNDDGSSQHEKNAAAEIDSAIIASLIAKYGEKNIVAMSKAQKATVKRLAQVLRFIKSADNKLVTGN